MRMNSNVNLNEFEKEEWHDICAEVAPHMTDEQFEAAWEEFQELKRKKAMQ